MANILDTIVEQKQREVAQMPARLIAAGDLRDAMLEARSTGTSARTPMVLQEQAGHYGSASGSEPDVQLAA